MSDLGGWDPENLLEHKKCWTILKGIRKAKRGNEIVLADEGKEREESLQVY